MIERLLPPWFAIQVRPRSEKTVHSILQNKGFAPFLPTCNSAPDSAAGGPPMFPGYLFCRLDFSTRLLALYTTPGFHRLVGAGRCPIAVSDEEIECIRLVMASGLPTLPWPRLEVGTPVEVASGPLAGLQGVLLAFRRKNHLVVSVHLLQRAVAVEVDACCVRPLPRIGPLPAGPARLALRASA